MLTDHTDRFDPRVLMQLSNNDYSVFYEVVTVFKAQCPFHINEMGLAAAEGSLSGVLFRAHAVKGMAIQMGASRLQHLSEGMERLAREGGKPDALTALHKAIHHEYIALCVLLDAYKEAEVLQ